MKDTVQQKVQTVIHHADGALGYGVATGVGSTPIWLDSVTGWLELVAVLIAIGVGLSTWQLNRAKIRKLQDKK